jgi:capsular exopolysaccharide synthesis family protein
MFAPQDNANSGLRGLLGKFGFKRETPAADTVAKTDDAESSMSAEELAEAARLAPYVEALQLGLAVDPVKETRLPIKETRLINIAFTHTDPDMATRIVNTLADTYVRSNLENKYDVNAMTREILQKRIAELKSQTRDGEERLIEYAKANEILSLDPSQNTVVDRLAGLNRQLLEAENERKLAEATYNAALAPGAAEALAESAIAREAAESNNRLAELRQRRAQLLVESTEEWPEVKEIDQQIAALEKHVVNNRDRAGSVMVRNLETKYRQSLAREQALRGAFNEQRGETLKQNEAAIYYRMMQQEVETGKELLDGLLQRQKENDGQLAGMLNNIRVNDYAVVPKVPIGPKRMLYTTVAFIFSLALSLGLAVLTDYMDNTMRSADDVEKTLQTRTLAAIPAAGISDYSRRPQLSRSSSIKDVMQHGVMLLSEALPKRNGNGAGRSPLLLTEDSDAWLNEVYRQLRTSILLSRPSGSLQTILVTASLPSEGKTTTAINTALSLARTGARVLLIDGDTRRPRVHHAFDFDNEEGLTTTLVNNQSEAEILSLIKVHDNSQLCVLTSGPAEPSFTELLGSPQMSRVMSHLQANFEYIIIDSPPVAHFADGILMSQMADGVLLVVNSGKTPREVVVNTKQTLHDVGAQVIGVVLNNVKILPYDYSYYPKYYAKPMGNDGQFAHNETAVGPISLNLAEPRLLPDTAHNDPRNG